MRGIRGDAKKRPNMRRRETQPQAQVARSMVVDVSAGRCKLYCWGSDIRQLGSQLLCQEETLPWGQQYHQHQGNHGYQVHPAGRRKKASEFNHHRSTGQALRAKEERHRTLTRSPGGPGRPLGPGSPRAPRFPSSPAGPGGP